MNVLLTCVGRRSYLAKYFKEAIPAASKVVGADCEPTAPGLFECDLRCQVCKVNDPEYIDQLLSLCKQYDITLLVSLNDLELPILSEHRAEFKKLGVNLIVSSKSVIDVCFDKYATYQWLIEKGYNTPATYLSVGDVMAAIDTGSLSWPLIVKPRQGSASIGVMKVHCEESLRAAVTLVNFEVQTGQLSSVSHSDGSRLIIQQCIEGEEYGLDVLNDFTHVTHQVMVKHKKSMRSGETDKACVVEHKGLQEIGASLGADLKHIGNLDCDIFIKDNEVFVLELNPRFGGGYPFSHIAGANYPSAIVAWASGKDWQPAKTEYKVGLVFSKVEGMISTDVSTVVKVDEMEACEALISEI